MKFEVASEENLRDRNVTIVTAIGCVSFIGILVYGEVRSRYQEKAKYEEKKKQQEGYAEKRRREYAEADSARRQEWDALAPEREARQKKEIADDLRRKIEKRMHATLREDRLARKLAESKQRQSRKQK